MGAGPWQSSGQVTRDRKEWRCAGYLFPPRLKPEPRTGYAGRNACRMLVAMLVAWSVTETVTVSVTDAVTGDPRRTRFGSPDLADQSPEVAARFLQGGVAVPYRWGTGGRCISCMQRPGGSDPGREGAVHAAAQGNLRGAASGDATGREPWFAGRRESEERQIVVLRGRHRFQDWRQSPHR